MRINTEDDSHADALYDIADALNRIAVALENGLTSAKVGDALDGLASLRYASFYEPKE